ncbi:hypothetical protein OSTOST_09516 [Ostertagia ostertagi]
MLAQDSYTEKTKPLQKALSEGVEEPRRITLKYFETYHFRKNLVRIWYIPNKVSTVLTACEWFHEPKVLTSAAARWALPV